MISVIYKKRALPLAYIVDSVLILDNFKTILIVIYI